jgi:hypothetical protein
MIKSDDEVFIWGWWFFSRTLYHHITKRIDSRHTTHSTQ